MSPEAFRAALAALGLTQAKAAPLLGAPSRHRVGDWYHGRRKVPRAVARHLETLLWALERVGSLPPT